MSSSDKKTNWPMIIVGIVMAVLSIVLVIFGGEFGLAVAVPSFSVSILLIALGVAKVL